MADDHFMNIVVFENKIFYITKTKILDSEYNSIFTDSFGILDCLFLRIENQEYIFICIGPDNAIIEFNRTTGEKTVISQDCLSVKMHIHMDKLYINKKSFFAVWFK